jgi:hypothetical protein
MIYSMISQRKVVLASPALSSTSGFNEGSCRQNDEIGVRRNRKEVPGSLEQFYDYAAG